MTNAYLLEHLNEIDKMAKTMSRGTRNYEDVRQEMCVACLELETGQPFKYVMRSIMNKAIDYLKSRRHNYSYENVKPHTSLEALLNSPTGKRSSPGFTSPSNVRLSYWYDEFLSILPWDDIEIDIRVDLILNTLNDEDRSLLYRYYLRGEKQQDIAEQEGVTGSMISKRLSIVLTKLRKRYNGG